MKPPVWLAEFHRQWLAARGKALGIRSRAFSRDWNQLLDDAGVLKAEDVATSLREAESLEKQGILVLKRHRYRRHLIEKASLPIASEAWLRGVFESVSPEDWLEMSLGYVREAAVCEHPLQKDRWREWCVEIESAFLQGKNLRPFSWRSPEAVREMLVMTFELTARIWQDTLIREASDKLGLESKVLESRRRTVESALASFFGRITPLEAIGIIEKESRVQIAGNICLHFEDGTSETITKFNACYHLGADLDRAVKIMTPAKRILTVENCKTTLRRLATLNGDGETLLIACSFPTRGMRRLLELLPADLPLFHFGDTDPAGFLILSKIREAAGRQVTPFLMHRRVRDTALPLSAYEISIVLRLLSDPLLDDVRPALQEIHESRDKGNFEQESLGVPDLQGWPFYRCHSC